MFKYSGSTCKPSCTGETVYVLSNTTTACFTSLGAFLDGERITTDGNCTSSCAAGSVVGEGGTVLTDLQEETLQCCKNTKSPCVHFCCSNGGTYPDCGSPGSTVRKEYFCDAVAVCVYHGLLLAQIDTPAKLTDILDIISQQDPAATQFWVNVRKISGTWVNIPSNTPVAAGDWATPPVDGECAYVDISANNRLKTAPCDGEKRAFPCVDPTNSLPVC
ncbi:uncharacterized protein LOC108672118 isoform X2 [Hyalella azteca]|uniref:Uncharacterized protein LOC108672118 isoform X2 n=1 Tax=Hyalella azteca TaxID=294128 RepID=A0A8B7NNJ8_HYAAZ|nr:uncharacterized protein LOC108672118 isoform X2 [Hyalella azteca]